MSKLFKSIYLEYRKLNIFLCHCENRSKLALKMTFLVALAVFFCSTFVLAEEITISTYYPSPYGVYNELQTSKLGVGDTDSSGGLDAADLPDADGQAYVARSVIFKPQGSDPVGNEKSGELYYNSTDDKFKYYNGSAWVA